MLLIALFLLSFAVRCFRLNDFLFFGFEQGRDAQIIENIYKLKDFVLIGPSTSIGGVFHGPWYYYLMTIPYGLGMGNPLAASLFLSLLGSFIPIIMYFLSKDLFKSRSWGIATAIITLFSYEYILYARWLSNVSLAPLFIALSFLMLWKFLTIRDSKYFLGFVVFASIATLFQMILIVQFVFFIFCLFIFRQMQLPSIKFIFLSMIIILILFGPLIIFDFRNQHISSLSLINFGKDINPGQESFSSGITHYIVQTIDHLRLSVVNIRSQPLQLFIIILSGVSLFNSFKKTGDKKVSLFLLSWVFMSLPIVKLSPGNPQYYAGVGLGWILLFSLTLKTLWESTRFRSVFFLLIFIYFAGITTTLKNLILNMDVFFRTTQDDLNLSDQRKVLDYIHSDSGMNGYKFLAFTIPSLHSEGWDYLRSYYYPKDQSDNKNAVYIAIEKGVYPVWENKWINDLGRTQLVFEKKIGLLRLQKRRVVKIN